MICIYEDEFLEEKMATPIRLILFDTPYNITTKIVYKISPRGTFCLTLCC